MLFDTSPKNMIPKTHLEIMIQMIRIWKHPVEKNIRPETMYQRRLSVINGACTDRTYTDIQHI